MDGFDKHMDGFTQQIKSFRNELSAHKIAMELKIDDLDDKIKGYLVDFKSELLGAISEAMSRTQKVDDEQEVFIGRTFENVKRLDDHETRLKILEQHSPAALWPTELTVLGAILTKIDRENQRWKKIQDNREERETLIGRTFETTLPRRGLTNLS